MFVFLLLKKVLSAYCYGHFTEAEEFWSQGHILSLYIYIYPNIIYINRYILYYDICLNENHQKHMSDALYGS